MHDAASSIPCGPGCGGGDLRGSRLPRTAILITAYCSLCWCFAALQTSIQITTGTKRLGLHAGVGRIARVWSPNISCLITQERMRFMSQVVTLYIVAPRGHEGSATTLHLNLPWQQHTHVTRASSSPQGSDFASGALSFSCSSRRLTRPCNHLRRTRTTQRTQLACRRGPLLSPRTC